MKTTIYLPMAAMLLTAALAVSAAAQHQVPLKGSLQGQEIDTPQGGPPPTTLAVDGSATGIATHVGQFSFTYQVTVNLASGTGPGSARLIADNGDSVYTTIAGASTPTSTPGVLSSQRLRNVVSQACASRTDMLDDSLQGLQLYLE